MAKCPSCNLSIRWDIAECPACNASFWARGGWCPIPESVEEEQQVREKAEQVGGEASVRVAEIERAYEQGHYIPGRLTLAFFSLGLAFLISAAFSPGGRILRLMVDLPLVQSLPPYKGHLLGTFANYWIPAIAIYLLLRLTRLHSLLRSRAAINRMIGIASFVLILYLVARIFASTVQGGGASFVVMSFSPVIVLPAEILILVGLIWLVARSINLRKEPASAVPPFNTAEKILIAPILAVPLGFASTFFVGKEAPFLLAHRASMIFEERCKMAGEHLSTAPIEGVQGIYLDPDGGARYERIENGAYAAYGGGIIGEPLVNSGWLLFFEHSNDRPRPEETGQHQYRKHALKDWKGEPVDQLTSKYAVFTQDLTIDAEQKLGVRGQQISIVDIATNETIAKTIYFVSAKHRKFCGHAPNGNFSVSDFIIRGLKLQRQFPSVYIQKPEDKK